MDTPAETYRELSARFTTVIETVAADAWDNPSPCEDWTAAQVLRHVISAERDSVKLGRLSFPDGPSAEDEPLPAWRQTRDELQALLEDPTRAAIEFDGFFGPTTLGRAIDDYYCFDLIVHRWDIARATGGDTAISTEEIAFVRAKLELYGDAMRMPGVFGAEVEAPAEADEQTRLLAFIGRVA